MDDIGWSELEIRAGLSRSFGSDLERDATRQATRAGSSAGTSLGKTMGGRASSAMRHQFSEAARYIAAPLLGAFAVEKVGELIGDSIRGAVEDAASENRAKLVFGPMTEQVDRFSEHAAKSYGVSDQAARSAAAGFGILFSQAKLSREENAKGSIQMVKLGADLAAFAHTDPSQAFTALQRGLAGSTRGLKPFGVLIDSTQQKAEALQLGLLKPVKDQAKIHSAQVAVLTDQKAYNDAITKHGQTSLEALSAQARLGSAQETLRKDVEGTLPALTAQQKVLANRALIMDQTQTQQGQFSRSSGELAQQQRILTASWDNAKDKLGKGLMPVATDFVKLVNRKVIPAVDDASTWFEHHGTPAIHGFTDEVKPLANQVLPALKTSLGDVFDVARDLAPKVKTIFQAFNSLPGGVQKAIVIGAGAAYLGKKTGLLGAGVKAATGGGGIAGALTGRGATPANPLYTFVVNGGPGGGNGAPVVTAAKGAEAAGAEAKAIVAAKAAAEAVRAAGGGVAAESSAAARAFKDAIFAHDATVLKDALSFGKGAGARGLLRGVLAAPIISPQEVIHPNPITGIGQFGPDIKSGPGAGVGSWADLDKTFTHMVKSGNLSGVLDQIHALAVEGAAIKGSSNPAVGLKDLDALLPRTEAKIARVTAGSKLADRSIRTFGMGANSTFDMATTHTAGYGDALAKLPKDIQVAVGTPGLLQSRKDIQGLTRDEHLTPKQVTTLYKLTGIPQARAEFDALQSHMGRHTTLSQQLDLTSGSGGGGMHVHGDVNITASSPKETDKWTREQRQRAGLDGTRRGVSSR